MGQRTDSQGNRCLRRYDGHHHRPFHDTIPHAQPPKGAAMWSPRAQCDKELFSRLLRRELEHTDNLSLWQDNVTELIIENDTVKA